MSKTLTSGKAQSKLAAIELKLEELHAELPAAQAREVLTVGEVYPIYQGRGEERTVVNATLVAQRVTAEGTTQYAFQVVDTGEFAQGTSRIISKEPEAEGAEKLRSSDKIKQIIERLTADKEAVAQALEEALARENLEVGQPYQIKVGRGKSAEVVTAVLLGIGEVLKPTKQVQEDGTVLEDTKVIEQLNFFYGAGFDARTVLLSRSAVVFASAEDDAEAAAETAADTAAEEAVDA